MIAALRDGPILVTGAEGFVGSWLVPELRKASYPVVGTCKPGVPHADLDASWVDVDLREAEQVHALLADVGPAAVVHLAGIAVPREAAADPEQAVRMNYVAVDHLLCAMQSSAPDARLLFISSGETYGPRPASAPPALESEPLAPANLYAATKAAAEQRVVLAWEEDGLDAVRARPFNHSGPRRPSRYAESAFARQVAELERGGGEPVVWVGNLTAIRDFSDVRDVVRAYLCLLESGESGQVYNVCSGQGRSIEQVLQHLLGRARRELRAEVDPERWEEIDPEHRALTGDPARLKELGWSPRRAFEQTLDDLLDYWRESA